MATKAANVSIRVHAASLVHPPRPLAPRLTRAPANPIIAPRAENAWESVATFNPAAIQLNGRVHLLYRAIGSFGISVLGYASSSDGINFDERLDEPVYVPRESFEMTPAPQERPGPPQPYVRKYASGGGYGGCEDPRLTRIGDTLYMTYVAFDGFSPPRVALSSIGVDDFLAKRWDWTRPVLISPPGVVDKNAVVFPAQIAGRYVIFHRIFPDMLIDFRDTLVFRPGEFLSGRFAIAPRQGFWDSRKIGAGPPPLRVDDGWLLIYHAVDDRDDSQYKIGAMVLDAENPLRVLFRSPTPILEPRARYENEGHKSGVVYPCGAVTVGDDLFLYYGGADMVVCAATCSLSRLLRELKAAA